MVSTHDRHERIGMKKLRCNIHRLRFRHAERTGEQRAVHRAARRTNKTDYIDQ